ncbi:hypothetical protein R1flu_011141 [Riccia fluitans]|uniref:Uncharacterized protein n=1 Tax=Riccia fluitans TaxID=41844 RepID=A0ABD1Z813_9MARC
MYFKLFKTWCNVEVIFLSKVEGEPLAAEVIFLPFVKSCIDDIEVGEENAGVLIAGLVDGVDPNLVARVLTNFVKDDPTTVRWPILQIKMEKNRTILGHLYKAFVDFYLPKDSHDPAELGVKKKRAYNSIKRQKLDLALVLEKNLIRKHAVEPLPHKESEKENSDGIIYRIAKAYTRNDVYEEIYNKMTVVNLHPFPKIAFNDI